MKHAVEALGFLSVTRVISWPVAIVRRGREDPQRLGLGSSRGSGSPQWLHVWRGGSIVWRIRHVKADPTLGADN